MTGDEAISPVRALRPVGTTGDEKTQPGPEGIRVDLEGGSVEVLVRGASEGRKHDNLLLLSEPREATTEVLAALLPAAHVVAPSIGDLGWHRRSRDARASTARAVVQLMDRFSIERAVLVGTEAGAELAVAVAAAHPDRVGALVLINGGLGGAGDTDTRGHDTCASPRDELAALRVPVAFLFGGSVGEASGYTTASVNATTAWLRHVDAQQVLPGDDGSFQEHALATAADIVEAQLASVRARAAHPATGSHRVITPADDED